MAILPNFVGVGARKAGTTWLAECLREHPEIFMSTPKELSYFGKRYRTSRSEEWYLSHFQHAGDYRAVGEYSPSYIRDPDAAKRILEDLGEVKIICALRNPVERFLSDYKQGIRDKKLELDKQLYNTEKLASIIIAALPMGWPSSSLMSVREMSTGMRRPSFVCR